MHGNRETSEVPSQEGDGGRPENAVSGTAGLYASEESDGLIVPKKRANKVVSATVPARRDGGKRASQGQRLKGRVAPDSEPQCAMSGPRRRTSGHQAPHGWWRSGPFVTDPRQEPYEVVPHVRICAGGRPKGRFLPRPN